MTGIVWILWCDIMDENAKKKEVEEVKLADIPPEQSKEALTRASLEKRITNERDDVIDISVPYGENGYVFKPDYFEYWEIVHPQEMSVFHSYTDVVGIEYESPLNSGPSSTIILHMKNGKDIKVFQDEERKSIHEQYKEVKRICSWWGKARKG